MTTPYERAFRASIDDPEAFWLGAAAAVDWVQPPTRGIDESAAAEDGGWFPGASLNTAHNCLDRHVAAGRGATAALIYDSPVTDTIRSYSYSELLDEVEQVARMLVRLGAGRGDRIILYMPMIPETVFAMLACARIGAVHSVVFGGFAAAELAKRIDDATPCLVLAASCGIEGNRTIPYKPLVDEALALAVHRPHHAVILQREQFTTVLNAPRDLDWASLRAETANDPAPPCITVAATDPLYILYTSGTTGVPKGVVRDNGGHAVALSWSMANIYGIGAGDVFWAASDVGWVVGHSYIVYAPLLVGATTVLFEGKPVGTPDAGTYWRTIARHRVKAFFTAPTAIRAIRKEDPEAEFLRTMGIGQCMAIFLAGERADPATIAWAEQYAGVPVIDHWWQTELGWPAIASCFALGDKRRRRGSAGFPVPGYAFAVLGDDGQPVEPGASGFVAIKTPLPPGAFRSLWNNEAGYDRNFAAFPGWYETGDAGYFDSDGFLHIMGRTDDIVNVAGHRLSTGQMEQIVAAQPGVAECAVIGADDALKGMVPVAFVVPSAAAKGDEGMAARVIDAVRHDLGPVAALKTVWIVPQLPKTRSGKILRNLLRQICNGDDWQMPPTIENPGAASAVAAILGHSIPTDRFL
jgi:propionyl-CoA synthetase